MLHYELIRAVESREGKTRPLMIMLHGLGDSIEGYRWLPEAMALPWLNYLLVNAPDDYFGGFSWFDYPDNYKPGVERSRKLLFELLDGLHAKGFPAEQITFGGFSQGCVLAVEIGLRYPHLLAGVVGISGWVCEPEKLLKELSPVATRQRVLVTHGTQDPLVPFALVQGQVRQLKTAGLNVEWHEFAKVHTIIEDELDVVRKFVRAGYPVVGK